jgi:anti-anti-sigma factor
MQIADVVFEESDGAVVARLSGEIDISNSERLRVVLQERITNSAKALVLDLTAVGYVDSAGIHLVYELSRRLDGRGQELWMVVPPDSPAAAALWYAGVLDDLQVAANLDGALAALAR